MMSPFTGLVALHMTSPLTILIAFQLISPFTTFVAGSVAKRVKAPFYD